MKCVFGFNLSVYAYKLLDDDASSHFSDVCVQEIQKHLQEGETVILTYGSEETNTVASSPSITAVELIKLQSEQLKQRKQCRKYFRIYIYVAEENLQATQERCFALFSKLGINNIRSLTKDELKLNQKEKGIGFGDRTYNYLV